MEDQEENLEENKYIEESDDEEELLDAMYEDEETNLIMESVFGEYLEDD